MNRLLGMIVVSAFLMSCNATGFLSNGGADGKPSKSLKAGSNADIGYRNGKFLPTAEELEILSSAEYSRMVDYDLDEANAEVEYSYTENLGIALVDLDLASPKDAEIAIDHALAYFSSADIAALTEIQEGTSEHYDPYFDFEKEYGYSISESERFNRVHFPELVASSKGSNGLKLQDFNDGGLYSEDNFNTNNAPSDFENHFITNGTNGYGGQKAADDWNNSDPNRSHQMVYGEVNGTQYFNLEAKEGTNEVSKGFGSNGTQSWAWNKVENPGGDSYLYKTIYNANGQEVARIVEAYSKDGKRKLENCAEGYRSEGGVCKKDITEAQLPPPEEEKVEDSETGQVVQGA